MAETNNLLTGIKKRQQIANANKMIFVWVIIASVAISLCGVTVQFLFRQASFNQRVIGAKLETQGTLAKNLDNVPGLKKNVEELIADERLAKVKANETDSNLKVVLDALPTSDDKSALGASLQQVILPRSQVDTSDLTTITPEEVTDAAKAETSGSAPVSRFSFSAAGDYVRVQAMLVDMERTIRPMNIEAMTMQSVDNAIRVTVAGVTYYYPAQTVALGKKAIKP